MFYLSSIYSIFFYIIASCIQLDFPAGSYDLETQKACHNAEESMSAEEYLSFQGYKTSSPLRKNQIEGEGLIKLI